VFNPSREDVRRFFTSAWAKYRSKSPLAGLEAIAVELILMHPEHHAELERADGDLSRDHAIDVGRTSPFLHLSLHLAVEEQLSIDQPPGLRAEHERIAAKLGDRHAARHALLECLGETLWRAQRDGSAPDAQSYLECMRRR
jgi:hypothetical protein